MTVMLWPSASISSERSRRTRWRQVLKLKPVSLTNLRLSVRVLSAPQLAQASIARASAGSAIKALAMRSKASRGGPAGFVQVQDVHTLAFGDWPGNNRIASLRNLQSDSRLAMLFLFPGLNIFLRINGRGRISTDSELRESLGAAGKTPKAATLVRIDKVLFHCGRAVNRPSSGRPMPTTRTPCATRSIEPHQTGTPFA